jgi:putative ABC transport system ATP-binding protein
LVSFSKAFHLLPTFTALENVQIPMFGTHRCVSERKHRASELLKAVGLETRLHNFPAKLSGGEHQCVAIARSLANGASVLCLLTSRRAIWTARTRT